jgi:phosphate transport system ATP-binding protein
MSTTEQSSAPVAEGASFGGVQARSAATINTTSRISVRNLDFFYGSGDTKALKGINLELPDRQVTGMIGPSGCGKSTLLRVLNRMYSQIGRAHV